MGINAGLTKLVEVSRIYANISPLVLYNISVDFII